MKVHLSSQAEDLLRQVMAEGQFDEPGDAITAGLSAYLDCATSINKLLEDRDQAWWDELNHSLRKAIADVEAGNFVEGSPELFEEIKRRGRERLKARENQSA